MFIFIVKIWHSNGTEGKSRAIIYTKKQKTGQKIGEGESRTLGKN